MARTVAVRQSVYNDHISFRHVIDSSLRKGVVRKPNATGGVVWSCRSILGFDHLYIRSRPMENKSLRFYSDETSLTREKVYHPQTRHVVGLQSCPLESPRLLICTLPVWLKARVSLRFILPHHLAYEEHGFSSKPTSPAALCIGSGSRISDPTTIPLP